MTYEATKAQRAYAIITQLAMSKVDTRNPGSFIQSPFSSTMLPHLSLSIIVYATVQMAQLLAGGKNQKALVLHCRTNSCFG